MEIFILFLKFIISSVILILGFKLINKGVSESKFIVCIVGLFSLLVIWSVDFKYVSKFALLGVEIDRRVELAEETLSRLKNMEETSKKTADNLQTLNKNAEITINRLSKLEQASQFRNWALVRPDGSFLIDPYKKVAIQVDNDALAKKVFNISKEGKWSWMCDDKTTKSLDQLILDFPQLPYALVAKVACLKKQNDPSWKENSNEIRGLINILKGISPHAEEVDLFSQEYENFWNDK